jgi:hypothetical protein
LEHAAHRLPAFLQPWLMLVAGLAQMLPLLQLVVVVPVIVLLLLLLLRGLLVLQPVLYWRWLLHQVLLVLCLVPASVLALHSAAARASLSQSPGIHPPAVPAVTASL